MSQVSSFTQEMADIICERIAKGESLRKICLDKDTPSHTTILKWLRDIDGFASQYARARETTLFNSVRKIRIISPGNYATLR